LFVFRASNYTQAQRLVFDLRPASFNALVWRYRVKCEGYRSLDSSRQRMWRRDS
jgi:hypothetical protein